MKNLFLWIWQLPQNLLGLIAIGLLSAYKPTFDSNPAIWTHYKTFFSSVSLGDYIIVNGYSFDERTVLHEKGHQRQSRLLGWLYLPLIGLPSVVGNLIFRLEYIQVRFNYYKLPWEKWADKLGGVERH